MYPFIALIGRALVLVLAVSLAAPSRAETEAEKQARERREREQALFGNIGKVNAAQNDITRNAALGNRNASNLSNLLGRNSIGRGLRHIRHGRVSHNRPEVRVGYFEVAQGILGLLAAAQAARNSDVSGARTNLYNEVAGAGPASATAAGSGAGGAANSPAAGASRATADDWKKVHSDLDTEEARSAFKEIEEEYGITKKELLAELRAGRDGGLLLEEAKTNAEEKDEILASLKEARERNAREAAGEGRGLASLSAPVPAADPSPAAVDPSPSSLAAAKAKKGSLRDELRARLDEMPDAVTEDPGLSPEVRAALAAREAEQAAARAREARAHASLFDVVHAKYAEKEGMIRGWIKSPAAE